MREYINKVKNFEQFFNEGLKDYQLNNILDKITDNGIDSLSNHEKTLLKFLDKHVKRMPRTALRYSLERLSENKRKYYMSVK
jgi:hypothetical protein